MSKKIAAMLILLVAVSASFAQVKGPSEVSVPVGRLAPIPLTIDADEADYAILGDSLDGLREYDPDPKKLKLRVIGYQPGVSYVVVSSRTKEKLHPLFVVKVVVGGGPPPIPPVPVPPGPTPPPDPKPVPIEVGKLFVVIIEETRGAVANRGGWFSNSKLEAAMQAKGHKWRCVDKDVVNAEGQTPADVKRFIDAAKSSTLPTLFLVNENGKTVYTGVAPTKAEELIALLIKYGG